LLCWQPFLSSYIGLADHFRWWVSNFPTVVSSEETAGI
jgi:hypothetical protein